MGGLVLAAPAVAAQPSSSASSTSGGPANTTSEPSESAASAVAVAFGHDVLVSSDTTATSQTSALPDGTFQLDESTVPVRVKTSTGWTPVDLNLGSSSDGFLAPVATDTPVEFSAGGTSVLAKVETSTGQWLQEASPFGVLPTPTVDGPVATYANVLPGVDLRLTATAEGTSEVLVISSASAAANPLLSAVKFTVSGSALTSNVDGLSTATAPDGSTVLSTTPTWWDSSDGSDASGPEGDAFADPVAQTDSDSSIALNAQAAVASRAVQYPVFVDPDWTGGLQAYTYVDKAYPTQSYWDGAYATGQQRTGYVAAAYSSDSRNHTARSLWQVDTSGVEGATILAANFAVTEDWSFNCTPSEVDLYWSGGISSGTTWNAQPGLIHELSSATTAHGASSSCPTAAVGFSATAGVQAAANAYATGLTLELKAANEASNTSWKRFTQAASITITYDRTPNVPTSSAITSPSRTCGSSSAPAFLNSSYGVSVQAYFTDPDGGNLTPTFRLYNGAGSLVTSYTPAASAEGNIGWAIPASVLPTDTLFYWTASSSDGTLTSGQSAGCYFSTLNSDPDLPTISGIPAGGTVHVGQSFTVQFNSASVDHVVSYAYWWGDGAPSATTVPPVGSGGGVRTAPVVGSSGSSASITVAPIDDTSTLYVTAYDAVGNESKAGSSYATGDEVIASPSTTVNYTSGHEWYLDGLTSTTSLPNPVVDSNTTAGTGLTSSANVSLGSAVNTTTTDDPDDFDIVPVFDFTPVTSPTAANIAATSGPTVDTTQSFTATAWANPTAIPSSGTETLISQAGSVNSGFTLGLNSGGHWQFCIQPQVTGTTADCAVSSSTAVLSQWTEVTGIWDSVNQQVRLLIGNTMVGPVTNHTIPGGDATASGHLQIGSALASGAIAGQWSGEIDDPAIFPGVIDENQLADLAAFTLIS
jgi:hypothetical protein